MSYAPNNLIVERPGTATVVFESLESSSCDYRIRDTILNAPLEELTFLNLNLRREILRELRLKVSGTVNTQNALGNNDLPLACDYFFYVGSSQQNDFMHTSVQFVNAKSGAIEWSVHLEHEDCEGVSLQLAQLLN